ncbi:hypothetical protein FRC08_010178 [Ceratobasidium sp. 394]|nr:hypothetical protein FRC08_010178 [Ceratobasidium sp. 394]
MGGSTPQEAAEAEINRPRQPVRGSEENSEVSRRSRAQPGAKAVCAGDRPTDPATGPSIVVFSSGARTSRPRVTSSRSQARPSSNRARKEKKLRDPNAPKQPPPAYIVYQNEIRETMRARFPGHSPTEIVKEIAAMWKTLPNSERQRYKDYASVEKDHWVEELAAYQATLSTPDKSQPTKSSKGSFLATAGISDSPPGSSPPHLPRASDVEAESHDMRRVASQDAPSGSTTSGHAYQAPLQTTSSFPGLASMSIAGTSSPRPSPEAGPSYPPRLERPHSRLASAAFGSCGRASPLHAPSPPTGRPHLSGLHSGSRGCSARLPSLDSLVSGHPLSSEREYESVSKRP